MTTLERMTPAESDALWRAVSTRQHVRGVVYAVRSTGIYCASDCPSRRPTREQVSFFAAPASAEAAGYRACLRCRPDRREAEARQLAALLAGLEAAETTPTLTRLAQSAELSVAALKRLFARELGLSPSSYLKLQRSERLKARLQAGTEVTGALYEAGYGSSRALYEHTDELLGMTPGAYRRGGDGMTITYQLFDSEVGPGLIAATERGVCALYFGDALLAELGSEFPKAELAAGTLEPFVKAVRAYLAGQPELPLPLDVSPSAFQAKVWAALRAIPYGETRSYGEVAEAIGDPGAVRAVARACATNHVALAVPCHRVVRADGSLSGYRWGVERKAALLTREQRGRLFESVSKTA